MYASGGSLETNYRLITDDIRQIVSGAGNATPDDLEVLVAYGGSREPGWNGMTIANISLLTSDLKNNIIEGGNNSLARFPQANMGSADTLTSLLSWVYSRYEYERVFLILIGHGEAYTGMLFDQNHEDDPLTLSELTSALQKSGKNVELIGFDTCLMSSLEVATRVCGYAKYMVASEESEPAEGWQYTRFISAVAATPDRETEELATIILDTYLEIPARGKTLSLLDLGETGAVTSDLDRLSKNLEPLLGTTEGYNKLSAAFNGTQQFGITAIGTLDPATMDLSDMATVMMTGDPVVSETAQTLINSIQKMVIYSVHDDAILAAHGLAILSPLQITSPVFSYYLNEASITPSWDQFIIRYLKKKDAENQTEP